MESQSSWLVEPDNQSLWLGESDNQSLWLRESIKQSTWLNKPRIGCNLTLTVTNHNETYVEDHLLTLAYALTSIFIIFANSFVIIGLHRTKKSFTRFDCLFILLSSFDLLVGLLVLPYQIYIIYRTGELSCFEVAMKSTVCVLTSTLSGMTTCLIATDRYLSIARKSFAETHVTSSCIIKIIVIEIIISVMWCVFAVYASQQSRELPKVIFLANFAIYEGILLSAVIVINILLFRHIKNRARSLIYIHGQLPDKVIKHKSRVNKTILIISISLVIAYMPSFFGFVLASISKLQNKPTNASTAHKVVPWIILPTNINSGLNASIFLWRNKELRVYFRSVLKVVKRRKSLQIPLRTICGMHKQTAFNTWWLYAMSMEHLNKRLRNTW